MLKLKERAKSRSPLVCIPDPVPSVKSESGYFRSLSYPGVKGHRPTVSQATHRQNYGRPNIVTYHVEPEEAW